MAQKVAKAGRKDDIVIEEAVAALCAETRDDDVIHVVAERFETVAENDNQSNDITVQVSGEPLSAQERVINAAFACPAPLRVKSIGGQFGHRITFEVGDEVSR